MIYLDHAATTPLRPEVLQVMQEIWAEVPGNPSSMHQAGREASRHLTRARESIAGLLGANPRELYFTSGATEANNWVLHAHPGRLITSTIEHPSILAPAEARDAEFLSPDAVGRISPSDVERALTQPAALVSLHWVNNELGTRQDVAAIGELCRAKGVSFHSDAVQAINYYEVDFPCDYLTLSAHKFGGPKGVGLLWARGKQPPALLLGGRQERGRRAGTENLAGIIGMAKALELLVPEREAATQHIHTLAESLLADLDGLEYRLHGPALADPDRVPGILNLYFTGVPGETFLLLLDRAGICVSLGSACEAGAAEPSHVLTALGLDQTEAGASIRISLGAQNTEAEIEETLQAIRRIIQNFRAR